MEEKHRKHIIQNVDKLISRTDYKKLAHACLIKGLLSSVMLHNVEKIEPDLCVNLTEEQIQYERHKRLFLKITKRGPSAYQNLCFLLADLKFDAALGTLIDVDDSRIRSLHKREEFINENFRQSEILNTASTTCRQEREDHNQHINHLNNYNAREVELLEFKGEIYPKTKLIVRKSTQIHKHPKLGTYPMQSRDRRGVFFMVNIINFLITEETRRGAEEDGESLLFLFRELGFKLFAYTNLTQADFFHLLEGLLDSNYTRETECFVMALMTHGTRDDDGFERVTFHDGSIVKVEDIEKSFQNHKCPNLQNKPKIFIFPFCRGKMAERRIPERIQTDSVRYVKVTDAPQLSDVLICYAASPGFKAHRDVDDGSWYIQKFVEMTAEHAHDTSLEEIVKMIQEGTANYRTINGYSQTANSVNMGFNKALYFNPGIWVE